MDSRLPIIGIIGSGSKPYSGLSGPLGIWIAQNGYHLVNGGGSGVMTTAAKAFTEVSNRKGFTLGILPSNDFCDNSNKRLNFSPSTGYPNPYIEIPIKTHLPLSGASGLEIASRNHIVVLTADVLIALPGSEGTRSEIQLALEYNKPLIILNIKGCWNEFKSSSAKLVQTTQEAIEELKKVFQS